MTTRRPIPNTSSSSHNHSNHSHAIPDSTFIDLSGADNSSNSSSVTSSHAHSEHEAAHGGHSHAHGGHSHAHGHGGHDEHDEHKAAQSVLAQLGGLSGAWRRLAGSRHTATLLAFASAYTLVAGGIFAYGIYCDSLALVADACGQLFACAALAIRLASTVAETAPPTSRYAYGLRRLEVLLSFCGGASAVFVALFLIAEAVEHVLHADPHIAGAHLMTAAVVGLLAKLLGALFFYDYMRARSETAQPFEEAGDQWRHLIVDAVCSICVIFNSWLVTWRDATLADAVVAFLLAALLIGAAVPVCLRAGFVLLHTTPAVRRDDLAAATRDAQLLPGVIECRNAHFWTLAPAVYSGSVVVRVRPDANHGQILSSVRDLFSPFVQHLTVGIERDDLLQKS